MNEAALLKLSLAVGGLFTGMLTTLFATWFKHLFEKRADLAKAKASFLIDYLYPLRIAALELRNQISQVRQSLAKTGAEHYDLQTWFEWSKDHVLGNKDTMSDEERREDFARHSGGTGCEAVSTLYLTAYYLYFATRLLFRTPYTERGGQLFQAINDVRNCLSKIDFYRVTQDSTGASMKAEVGEVMNYREFGEALTNKCERAWFLTLTDTYCKFRTQRPEDVEAIIQRLETLIGILESELKPTQPVRKFAGQQTIARAAS